MSNRASDKNKTAIFPNANEGEDDNSFENEYENLDNISEFEDELDNKEHIPKSDKGDIIISKSKMVLIKKLLSNIKENTDILNQLLGGYISVEDEERISVGQIADDSFKAVDSEETDGRIVEGVFDGENMVGPDGKIYSVPANYASKSKLVEGDIMKLTITPNGTFIYKQIGPIERVRVVGALEKTADGNFYVLADGRKWRVLTASVTYYKGQANDEAVILVPKTGESKWAAVENVIRNKE